MMKTIYEQVISWDEKFILLPETKLLMFYSTVHVYYISSIMKYTIRIIIQNVIYEV